MLKKSPSQTELNNLIAALNTGNFSAAEAIAKPLSRTYPKATLVWKILGVAIAEQGKMAEAIEPMRKVVLLEPKDAEAHRNLATALKEIGEITQAEAHFRKTIALNPQDMLAYISLGKILNEQRNYIDADKLCRKAITLKYDIPELHDQLGIALLGQIKLAEAENSFRTAILLNHDMADAHNNLGIILNEQARYAEAETSYLQALKLNPIFTNAFVNLAKNFADQDKYEPAEKAYRKATEIDPSHTLSLSGLGLMQLRQKKADEARINLEKALELDSHHAETLNTLGTAYTELGNTQVALECYQKAIDIKPNFTFAYSNLLLLAGYHAALSPEQLLDKAKQYSTYISAQTKIKYTSWKCKLPNDSTNTKIRVGFVSGDLRKHAVTFFLEGLLRNLDKNKFELIAYHSQPKEDYVSALIKPHFIKWQPIYDRNDQDAAQTIYEDAPHILIDLSGHTAYNRLPIFAHKPAPIQLTWLGYPATTGLTDIDYILGDPYLTPADEEHLFVEKVWRLPEIVWCFNPLFDDVPIAELPALKNNYITFGSFNNLAKINDNVVKVWADILHALPTAKLYLQARQLNEPSVMQKTYTRFAAVGITNDRLILEESGNRENYFHSFNKMDIALDPFPCPGGTTSADTVWMSVPILTMKGQSYWSRIGETIANNIGLEEWIADDIEDYINKAIKFASNLPALATLRANLRQQAMKSPLFDAPRYARNFEAALTQMVAIHNTEK